MNLTTDTVRGRVNQFVEQCTSVVRGPVLEIGSRIDDDGCAWWADYRSRFPGVEWVGLDIQSGVHVDVVGNAEQLPYDDASFQTVLCLETLEHCYRPWKVVQEVSRVLRPGGFAIMTTLFCFPIHGYPDDYWRFTPHCLELLVRDAGLEPVSIESDGRVDFILNDHGEPGRTVRDAPMHVFALAKKGDADGAV